MTCWKTIQQRLCVMTKSEVGSWMVGSVTEADNQSSFHCAVTQTAVMADSMLTAATSTVLTADTDEDDDDNDDDDDDC